MHPIHEFRGARVTQRRCRPVGLGPFSSHKQITLSAEEEVRGLEPILRVEVPVGVRWGR